jgi:SHS2 domain-containing protein
MAAGYELIDHTADVMLRACGATREEVFEQAALATVSLLYDAATVRPGERFAVEVGAPDTELLLAAWLNELLFLIEARRLVFARFEVQSVASEEAAGVAPTAPQAVLRATAVGEAFDGRRHAVRSVVKAATVHNLSLREVPGGWEGRVLLDV